MTVFAIEDKCKVSVQLQSVTEFPQAPFGADPEDYFVATDKNSGAEHLFVYDYSLSNGLKKVKPSWGTISLYEYDAEKDSLGKFIATIESSKMTVDLPCSQTGKKPAIALYYYIGYDEHEGNVCFSLESLINDKVRFRRVTCMTSRHLSVRGFLPFAEEKPEFRLKD
jgi:hypothetical protein